VSVKLGEPVHGLKARTNEANPPGTFFMTAILRRIGLHSRLLLSVICLLTATLPASAVDEAIDSIMYTHPDVPTARVVPVFPPRLISLWLQALERPENDLKYQAAGTIALAHRRGMSGLEVTIPALLRTLDGPEQHPTVRLAAAQALITLDARQAAESLFKHAQTDGLEMRSLVEPALARWDYRPVRDIWVQRINQSGVPGRGWLLAFEGLAEVRETAAVPRLRELAMSPSTEPIIRLGAARALGAIQATGLEKEAELLTAEQGAERHVASLAAASLLRNHRGDQASKLLQRLAVEAEPAAAAVALQALLEDNPDRVLSLLTQVVVSPDASVREKAVEAHRRRPLPEHIPLVAQLLDDPHPQVRTGARKALLEAAKAGHGDLVRQEATRLLATERWRALEQSTILLTLLDHKPAAARFIELLQSERPEVFLAAAWGLRKLALPETLSAQLREVERRWQLSLQPDENRPRGMIDLQVAQLAQSLGWAKYSPAAPVLARFVPKQWNIGPESRAAAIWALGLIHQEAPPEALVGALIGRLTDESVIMVEDLGVRRMCAIALGRMKAEEAVDSLRKYYPRKLSAEPFPNACGWGLQAITGEPLPTSGIHEVVQRGWFLEGNN
jgi:HEAT repeat protein